MEKQITFPLVQIDPHEPGVSILEIEARAQRDFDGYSIRYAPLSTGELS